jgi:hypothetical protein
MKNNYGKPVFKTCVFSLACLVLAGCATIARNVHYTSLAKEHPFNYFFPSSDFSLKLSSLDEAYEFVNTATAKFSQTVVSKRRIKGLAAKLLGPAVKDSPVVLICFIRASNTSGAIDLSKINKSLDEGLRQAEDALLFFCVFHNERGISLSNFYLDQKWDGYANDANRQIQSFVISGNTYKADYSVGNIEKAFSYLRGDIN